MLRQYSHDEIITFKSKEHPLDVITDLKFYLSELKIKGSNFFKINFKTPKKNNENPASQYISQYYFIVLSQLILKSGFNIQRYPKDVPSEEIMRLELIAEKLTKHYLKRKLNQIKKLEHITFEAHLEILDPHHHLNSIYVRDNKKLLNLLPDFNAIYVELRNGSIHENREIELLSEKNLLVDVQFLGRKPRSLTDPNTQAIKFNETVGYVRGEIHSHFKEGFIRDYANKYQGSCRCTDMCGPESKDNLEDLKRYINHAVHHKAQIIRIHIGETLIPNYGRNNVYNLFKLLDDKKNELKGKIIRLGHGTHMGINEMNECAQRGYYVEACLSSNKETGIITKRAEYPLGLMLLLDVKVMLGTDGGDLYYTDIKKEYSYAKKNIMNFLEKIKTSNEVVQLPNGDKLEFKLIKHLFKDIAEAKDWPDHKEMTYKDLELISAICEEKISLAKLVHNMNHFKALMFGGGKALSATLKLQKSDSPLSLSPPSLRSFSSFKNSAGGELKIKLIKKIDDYIVNLEEKIKKFREKNDIKNINKHEHKVRVLTEAKLLVVNDATLNEFKNQIGTAKKANTEWSASFFPSGTKKLVDLAEKYVKDHQPSAVKPSLKI